MIESIQIDLTERITEVEALSGHDVWSGVDTDNSECGLDIYYRSFFPEGLPDSSGGVDNIHITHVIDKAVPCMIFKVGINLMRVRVIPHHSLLGDGELSEGIEAEKKSYGDELYHTIKSVFKGLCDNALWDALVREYAKTAGDKIAVDMDEILHYDILDLLKEITECRLHNQTIKQPFMIMPTWTRDIKVFVVYVWTPEGAEEKERLGYLRNRGFVKVLYLEDVKDPEPEKPDPPGPVDPIDPDPPADECLCDRLIDAITAIRDECRASQQEPEIPVEPEVPVEPQDPEKPEEPEDPEEPDLPVEPEEPKVLKATTFLVDQEPNSLRFKSTTTSVLIELKRWFLITRDDEGNYGIEYVEEPKREEPENPEEPEEEKATE